MTNELRRKLNLLGKNLSDNFKYEKITEKQDLYLLIMISEGENFLLSKEEVCENFQYIDKMNRCYYTGLYPGDIRTIKKEGDSYDF